jgi:hypothetical protein
MGALPIQTLTQMMMMQTPMMQTLTVPAQPLMMQTLTQMPMQTQQFQMQMPMQTQQGPQMGEMMRQGEPPRAPRPKVLEHHGNKVFWRVQRKQLKTKDCKAVSPGFEIEDSRGRKLGCKMMIKPQRTHDSRGGSNFRTAKGKGSVLLCCPKCPAEDFWVTYRITVCSGLNTGEPRGSVKHNLKVNTTSCLPDQVWDFNQHVNTETETFEVVLEILEVGAAA